MYCECRCERLRRNKVQQRRGRAKFNDVCDYDGLSDTGARDRNGAAVPGLNAYKVVVAVNDRGLSLGAPALNSDAGQIVRVDVIVTHAALAHAGESRSLQSQCAMDA